MARVASLNNRITLSRRLARHLLAGASLLWVCANLLIALSLLLSIAIIRMLLAVRPIQNFCDYLIEGLYRWAVAVDTFWIKHIIGIELEVIGELSTHPAPVVICNHHNAFDIPIVQEIISGKGPLLKFLIKKELVWMPIFGWVCFLLDFPRLNRNKKKNGRAKDYATVKAATEQHGIERRKHSGALLIFPEGTRYTPAKAKRQGSAYRHLMNPKSGGLSIIQQYAAPGTPLIDITIDYGQGHLARAEVSLWSCLYGVPEKITVHVSHYELSDITDIQSWLNERWQQKDKLLK